MTSNQFLDYLNKPEAAATDWKDLIGSEDPSTTLLLHALGDPDALAWVLILCEDGLLRIPFMTFFPFSPQICYYRI